MPKNSEGPYRYTQNRELSWLRFDRRVLEEAADSGVPALERLKFVSIFSSNLDEFFMVRVGSLFDLAHMTPDDTDNKTGWTPAEQLQRIYRAVPGLLAMKKQIYHAVMEELQRSGVQDVSAEALDASDLKQVNRFFKTELLPVLSPIVIAPNHPVPHLVNKKLYAAALLESKRDTGQSALCRFPRVCCRFCCFRRNALCAHGKYPLALTAGAVRRLYREGKLCFGCDPQRGHQLR